MAALTGSSDRAGADVFVGRAREIAELEAALERAIAGRGALVLIAGEPGIGKTLLAEQIAVRAAERGANVFWGRCWEGEGAPAFWPWLQVIRAYVRQCDPPTLASRLGAAAPFLAQIVPEIRDALPDLPALPPLDSEQTRFRLYEACGAFLRSAARETPLVVVLDDLHWSDKSSLLLLHFLTRELPESRVLVLATYRDVEVGPGQPLGEVLPRLRREHAVQRVLLRGLVEPDVQTLLAASRGNDVPESLARNLAAETAGNPFFIKEILRHLHEGGDALRLPESIRDVIGRRLARLSAPCVELLASASAIGHEFATETIRRVTDLPNEQISDLLEEAVESRILVAVPHAIGRHRFSHALVREALYSNLRNIERVQLHARIAAVLERSPGAQLTELAHHFLESLPGGDARKALDYAVRAAAHASEQLGHTEAANFYRRALEALSLQEVPDETLRCELLLKLGEARWDAGGLGNPSDVFKEAAELAEKIGSPTLLARAVLGLTGPGIGFAFSPVTSMERRLFEKALAVLDPTDSALRARLLAKAAARRTFRFLESQLSASGREAIEMARRLGDEATLADVLQMAVWSILGPDNCEERVAIGAEIVELAERIGDPRLAAEGHRCLGDFYLEAGDAAAADRELRAQLRFTETTREPFQRWLGMLWRAGSACLEGRFADVDRYLRGAAEAEAEVGQDGSFNGSIAVARALEVHRRPLSDRDVAGMEANQLTRGLRAGGLGHAYLQLGRFDDARRIFETLAADDFAGLPRDYLWLWSMSAIQTELAIGLGDERRVAVIYDQLLPYAGRCAVAGRIVCSGSVARSLGRLATALGRYDAAEAHFEAALEMNRRIRARIWVAHTQHDYARMLHLRAAVGDREKAKSLFDECLAAAREIGMTVLEREITATLAELGLAASDDRAPQIGAAPEAVFRSDGELWTIAYEGRTVRTKDAKGFRYIAELLRHAGTEIHAATIAAGGDPSAATDRGDAGEILDAQARSEYKQRIEDLEAELDEATRWSDVGRASRCREELDFLKGELSAAVGLGGRARRAGNVAERARKAVASRIQDAIAKIRVENPALALHFANSIRLGTFCCYVPERPVAWLF